MTKLPYTLLILTNVFFSCNKKNTSPAIIKDPDYAKAKSFLNRQNDSAFYYFNQVVNKAKDSLQVAYAYNYMAMMQSDVGDYYGSQESLTASLRFLDPEKHEDRQGLASNYNELGLTSINLGNYDAAVDFFDRAIPFTTDSNYKLIYLNNKALAYQKKKAYLQASKIYEIIIGKKTDDETYARVLSNMARTQWLYDPAYNAAPELMRALRIRERINDQWGLNASYAHLAEYYTHLKTDSALLYATKMYSIAMRLNSPDDKLGALEKLIAVCPPPDTKKYFLRYHQLDDSLQTARNAAKNQFAFIRYEVEKNKADNLKLQNENSEKQLQLIKQRVLLYGILLTFIALTFFGIRWNRKRKQQQVLETQEAIRETQRKASKQVHDTLGNDIYRVLKNVQNAPTLDRGWLVENIDDVYKRARNLSYEINIPTNEDFPEHLSSLLQSFGTDDVRIILTGNKPSFWQKVHPTAKLELLYILQEMMVNMQKHSKATNVVLKFELEGTIGRINYFDDGIGIATGTKHQNGLANTGTRIKAIGGDIIFGNVMNKGLEIQLTFPIA